LLLLLLVVDWWEAGGGDDDDNNDRPHAFLLFDVTPVLGATLVWSAKVAFIRK